MMTTRVITAHDLSSIVAAVGLDQLLDDLIARLVDSFQHHDHEQVATVDRSGFSYGKPDVGILDLIRLVQERPKWEHKRSALTVFDSMGWALEDLVAAELVLEHAERLELGIVVDLLPVPRDPYDPYEVVRS